MDTLANAAGALLGGGTHHLGLVLLPEPCPTVSLSRVQRPSEFPQTKRSILISLTLLPYLHLIEAGGLEIEVHIEDTKF